MRRNFPPWLVEIVPELADIENNFIWNLLRRLDRNHGRHRLFGIVLITAAVLISTGVLPVSPEYFIGMLWLLHFWFLAFPGGSPSPRLLDAIKDERFLLMVLPLGGSDVALGLWAWTVSSSRRRARPSPILFIVVAAGVIAVQPRNPPFSVHAGTTLIFCAIPVLLVRWYSYNNSMRALVDGLLEVMRTPSSALYIKYIGLHAARWDTVHRIVPASVPVILIAMSCPMGIIMSVGSFLIVIGYFMILTSVTVYNLDSYGRERLRSRLPGELEDLSEIVDDVLASARGQLVLRGCDLVRMDYEGSDMSYSDCREANLSEARLCEADLRWADLSGAVLDRVDLSGANLTGADLRGARLVGANLRAARMAGARLEGADLLSARNLTRKQIDSAVTDATTRLPEGL